MKNVTYINASAGSGKTYTLTHLLAKLIKDKEVKPEQVIMTTFSVKAANEALADENAPFYKAELKAAVDAANALTDAATLDELTEAKTNVDTELSTFNGYNSHYAALKTAIDEAEAFIAGGMTNGADKFQEAINAAKTQLATAASDYTADAEGGAALTDTALAELNKAESSFRVLNASYANPANVITNGDMSSTAGWTILAEGANPDLHINTSGSVTNFSTPFMECWVNNTNYGKTNYATQTVNALPDGQELPAGYYVLKAAALATRQDQAGHCQGLHPRLRQEGSWRRTNLRTLYRREHRRQLDCLGRGGTATGRR